MTNTFLWLVRVLVGLVLVATAFSQNPIRSFDRARKYDPLGVLIPNWRFFAPIPATADYHVLHRFVTAEGPAEWQETFPLSDRRLLQAVWAPERRRDKSLFDVTAEIMTGLEGPREPDRQVGYRLLTAAVRRAVSGVSDTGAFQFAIVEVRRTVEGAPPRPVLISPVLEGGSR